MIVAHRHQAATVVLQAIGPSSSSSLDRLISRHVERALNAMSRHMVFQADRMQISSPGRHETGWWNVAAHRVSLLRLRPRHTDLAMGAKGHGPELRNGSPDAQGMDRPVSTKEMSMVEMIGIDLKGS